MLQSLHVKNLALIQETEIQFGPGLNILTGETGAGKSIIIGSISVALGEKIPKEMIRENQEYALVELIFSLDEKQKKILSSTFDIEIEENQLILSRKIYQGRNSCKINGETVLVSHLKKVGKFLIDIYGQQEHQSLTNKRQQLEILDVFTGTLGKQCKADVAKAYTTYRQLYNELETMNTDEDSRNRELSFLEFELKEIQNAQLRLGEDVQLEEEYKKLSNGKKITEVLSQVYQSTSGSTDSVSEQISYGTRELGKIASYDLALTNVEGQLLEIENLLNDFNREVSNYLDKNQFSEEIFLQVDKRLDVLNRMKSKYGKTIEAIIEQEKEKQKQMELLIHFEEKLNQLEKECKEAKDELKNHSILLTEIRKKQGLLLADEIKKALKDLNFLNVEFQINVIETEKYSANGWDEIEFLISTNPGEPLKPIEKVASGGELSRIMLALKSILANSESIDTLIFDEIDSGISGRTAQMVSEKMNVLSKEHQLLCITHLPQIASMADTHFLIKKEVKNHTTSTKIQKLSDQQQVIELARMLGGVEITETVKKNAQEMRDLALTMKTKR